MQCTEAMNKLTPELWAHTLQYLYLDEVLAFTAANKFLHQAVPGHITSLLIRDSDNLSPTIADRFKNVKEVYIYSLIAEIGPDHAESHWTKMDSIMENANQPMSPAQAHMIAMEGTANRSHLDLKTIERTIPFIVRFPKLECCFVGGLCTCSAGHHRGLTQEDVRVDIEYSPEGRYDVKDSNKCFASLISKACDAYAYGKLSSKVELIGLIDHQRCQFTGKPCAWKNVKMGCYRDDVRCQLCDKICMTFPPSQVAAFSDYQIPCISALNRNTIVKCRDPAWFKSNATELLLNELKSMDFMPCRFLPGYEQRRTVTFYSAPKIIKMNWLKANGANIKDPRAHELLCLKPEECCSDVAMYQGWDCSRNKRVILKNTFDYLKGIGFALDYDAFVIVRMSDPRANPSVGRTDGSDEHDEN